MREPAQPCPPQVFAEDGALPARRRALPVRPLHVCLRVRLDPTGPARVEGSVAHTVEAIGAGVRALPLDALDLEITGAWQGERALEWVQHAGGVRVDLARPLAAREQVTVRLDFVSRPTAGLYFVTGAEPDASRPQIWTQGAMEDHHHWFPCFDAPEHLVTTEVEATVPEPFVALSNGAPVGPEAGTPTEPGWRRFHWRHAEPHALYLLTLVVDTVERVEVPGGPVPMIHYAPPGRAEDTAAHFARMGEMIEWFGQATGCPYPYPRYGHVFLQRADGLELGVFQFLDRTGVGGAGEAEADEGESRFLLSHGEHLRVRAMHRGGGTADQSCSRLPGPRAGRMPQQWDIIKPGLGRPRLPIVSASLGTMGARQ